MGRKIGRENRGESEMKRSLGVRGGEGEKVS
jgi:hypothetical protein